MRKLAIIMLLASLAAVTHAALAWPDAVAIRQGVNIEWFRTGIETSDGGALYVWSDTKLGERDLWAQKVDAQGNMVWGAPRLIDGKPDRQEDPVVTRTSDNNYVIAWIDFSNDLDGNVYAQKVNNQGELLWGTGGKPVCTAVDVQIALNMEPDNAGGVYIVWSDSRNPSKDLYGQRLNASGDPVWTVNGIPIANDTGDEIQNTMLPDGQGGLMIGYTNTYVGAEDLYVKRFNPDGNMAWAQPLALCTAAGNQTGVRMASIGNGEFIFTWHDQRNDDPDIYAQKVNLSGNTLWQDPYVVYGDSGTPGFAPQLNPRIVATSDNGAIIIWEDFRLDNQNPDLFGQKLSAAGARLWGNDGIAISVAEFAQIGPRMDSDDNGGCYVVWDDLRNGNAPNDDIYAQHLSSAGQALWAANGKVVCDASNAQNGGLIKVAGNNIFINWMDTRTGSVGINYQVLSAAGSELLEDNGREVFWGLSGDTPLDQYQLLKRNNDTVAIWQDTRYANLGYQIFFQFINPDGSVDLETNGRPVTLSTGADQITPHAVVTPDDNIYIVWEDKRNDNPKIYMQRIDAVGNRMWGDYGLELTEMDPIRQKDPMISILHHSGTSWDIFVGWSNYDQVGGSFFYHVYGQRFANDQKMWGPNGVMVSTLTGNDLASECVLNDMVRDYYVWQRYNPMDGTQSVYVKRMAADGNPAAGWPVGGLLASTHSNWDTMQMFPVLSHTGSGVFVMWKDGRGDFVQNYWGQNLSEAGERLWDPLGVDLADYGREQEKPALLKDNHPFPQNITFAWCENINGMHDIIAQRYNMAGLPQWGNLGTFVVQKDSTQTDPSMAAFNGGGMVIAWTEFLSIESDIYYKYINPDGSMVGSVGGDVICAAGKAQYQPRVVTNDQYAYAIWADGRSSGKTEILGLYAQKLTRETVANDDNTAPPTAGFRLGQNYPNPFNPSTSIAFEINDPRAAYELGIYNARGQLVKTLHRGMLPAGKHVLVWDGTDSGGRGVASGVYYYRLSDGTSELSNKMLLMK